MGLVGFLAQVVTGMQGRLVPFYAWYRAFAVKGAPPEISANALPSPSFARPMFFLWAAGVPLLAFGFPAQSAVGIRLGALCLLASVGLSAVYVRSMLSRALAVGT